jgi:DNA-binding MarR family transcriptional regulator
MGSNTSSRPRSDPVRSILDSLRRLVHGIRVYDRAAERATGLSGAQLFVLSRLAAGGAATVNELARRTSTHQSSVSVVAHKLVDRKMAACAKSPSDGRCVEFILTGDGRRALARAPQTAQDKLIAAAELLASSQRRNLAQLLQRWTQLAGLAEAEPRMLLEDGGQTLGNKLETKSNGRTKSKTRRR